MELSVYIGNKIKYYREQMGMTQEDLAKKSKNDKAVDQQIRKWR